MKKRIFCITYEEDFGNFEVCQIVECYFDEEKAKEGAKIYQLDYEYEKRRYFVQRSVIK